MIVVIGPQWLAKKTPATFSQRVTKYVTRSHRRYGASKIIIPVAVDRAPLPPRGDLPEDIAALNDYQGYELGVDRQWRPTLGELLDDLSDLLQDRSTAPRLSQTVTESRPEIDETADLEVKSARHEAEVYISFMREDVDAARRLRDAIEGLGAHVWLDEERLRPGDAWVSENLTAIRRTVRLFIPIISANTESPGRKGMSSGSGAEAAERSHLDYGSALHRAGSHRRRLPRRPETLPAVSK